MAQQLANDHSLGLGSEEDELDRLADDVVDDIAKQLDEEDL
jgi:hypothetical protein